MQDIHWYLIYSPREKMNKLIRKVNKVLDICPITQKIPGMENHIKSLRFEMTGARVDPDTKEVLLVLKPKE